MGEEALASKMKIAPPVMTYILECFTQRAVENEKTMYASKAEREGERERDNNPSADRNTTHTNSTATPRHVICL
jgi:hypothetical protein